MSLAHQETVGMAVFTLVFLLIFVLALRFQRREGHRHPWLVPSGLLVVVGLALVTVTASGTVVSGW